MARSLVQSKITKELREGPLSDDQLDPGHMRLYNFYKPSLQTGLYTIEAKQIISAFRGEDHDPEPLTVFNRASTTSTDVLGQDFRVIAPQFSLDPKLVNTYYPPTGHQDEGRILPHVVFNDPHVPWFREAGRSPWMLGPVDTDAPHSDETSSPDGHSFVPWLALLVFEKFGVVGRDQDVVDDLFVSDADAKLLQLHGMKSYDYTKLPANGAFAMTVGEYLSTIKSRVHYEAGYDDAPADFTALQSSPEVMSAIFPKKSQIQGIFKATSADLSPLKAQKLLAHVRQINTIGFPDAGVEEEGYYSVVVSSMTGNQKRHTPSTHIVHLVSLEHLDATLKLDSFSNNDHSDRIGFAETMEALGKAAQPLRPPKETMDALHKAAIGQIDTPIAPGTSDSNPQISRPDPDLVAAALYTRMNAGYTIARWRTASGEESVAFNRGPLVPMRTQEVPKPQSSDDHSQPWPALSMTGKDYAVFDSNVGIMDATYSSAWSLGKLMAISDSVFNAALMRFRSSIWGDASSATRMQLNGTPSTTTVLQDSAAAVADAHAINGEDFGGSVTRIPKPEDPPVTTSMDDPKAVTVLRGEITKAVTSYASVGNDSNAPLYNGFDGKAGNNPDWEVILNWIHDVMYLATIPAHVLFPEPSHLHSKNPEALPPDQPTFHPEALRFFHIDHAWIDAYLDGALSCANHLEPEFDFTRLRIKAVFNDYLTRNIGNTTIFPPVPRYGFILRSALVKSTPDLRLKVTCWKQIKKSNPLTPAGSVNDWVEDPDRDPLVQHTKLDDFTILSLVDCLPEEIFMIKFSQPPHQQRFALPCDPIFDHTTGLVTDVESEMILRRLYTDEGLAPPNDPKPNDPHLVVSESDKLKWNALPKAQQIADQSGFYAPNTRCINPIKIAGNVNSKLLDWAKTYTGKQPYTNPVPNSSVLGLQLNDPAFELEIKGTKPPENADAFPQWTRKLWLEIADPDGSGSDSGTPNNGNETPPPKTPSNTVPPVSITINPHDPAIAHPPPPTTKLNGTKLVPADASNFIKPQNIAVTNLVDPFISSGSPQFELLIHPDYRPPPPRPFPVTKNHLASDVHSPLDYLPTDTDTLYDLIFAIRRRNNLDTNPRLNLQALVIEIPVSEDPVIADSDGKFREPLLKAGDYSGAGISMCSNPRFVPTLFSGRASRIGSQKWDQRAIVGIKLVPRSGSETGTLALRGDGKAAEASVRLSEPNVVKIVDHTTVAIVAQATPDGKVLPNIKPKMGRCLIRLTEIYGDDRKDEWSWCVALKVDSGDIDPFGQKI